MRVESILLAGLLVLAMMSSIIKVSKLSSSHLLSNLASSSRYYLISLCTLMRLMSPRSGTLCFHFYRYLSGMRLTI